MTRAPELAVADADANADADADADDRGAHDAGEIADTKNVDGRHRADAPAARPVSVEVIELVKRYPHMPTNSVDGVSFSVRTGEVFGLLGPNGAGKSTAIGILTTRIRPTSGTARINGVDVLTDPVRARHQLSVLAQQPNIDRSLTARQNLIFHAAYHGIGRAERARRADALLDQVGLGDRGKDKVDHFSGGMTQRLLIARALMHGPSVLFLDEPATGLDPQARLFVWDRIRDLRRSGVTIVLTTHDMAEAAALSDRVAIMDHGTLLALDTPAALIAQLPGRTALQLVARPAAGDDDGVRLRAALEQLPAVERVDPAPDTLIVDDASTAGPRPVALTVYFDGAGRSLVGAVVDRVTDQGGEVIGVQHREASLEDVFIQLTGRELR